MKTTKILGTTTLAGALLFTGVGATHSCRYTRNHITNTF